MSGQAPLTPDDVRKVARLSRLALSNEQVERYRVQLSAVLEYMDRLRQVDLTGVEPMAHAGAEGGAGGDESANRLDGDTPGPTLSTDALMSMAPDKSPPFIKVPRVIDEGGAA